MRCKGESFGRLLRSLLLMSKPAHAAGAKMGDVVRAGQRTAVALVLSDGWLAFLLADLVDLHIGVR